MSALKATLACDGPVFAAIQAIQAERDQLRAEVERLSALGSWAYTCTHHNDAMRAACPVCLVAALTAECDQLRAELAAERARLDSGQILLSDGWERVWHCGVDLRAAIDAAMKEGSK
jgi:hypothetical protein